MKQDCKRGKVIKFGDNINTDIISPPQYMEYGIEESSQYAMSAVCPDFAERVRAQKIMVAGKNFGSGSSRETSPLSLKYLGVEVIIAEFFARIFYRNAINVGLLVVECKEADKIREQDEVEVNYRSGLIHNLTKNETYTCTAIPLHLLQLIEGWRVGENIEKGVWSMTSLEDYMAYRNNHNEYAAFLGIRTTEMKEGYARGELVVRREFENAIGSVHGGCLFSLADTVGGSAAASYGLRTTTLSSDFHYLSPGIGQKKLYAEAKEIKRGKKISVYDVEITGEDGKLLAKGTFTFFNLGLPLIPEK